MARHRYQAPADQFDRALKMLARKGRAQNLVEADQALEKGGRPALEEYLGWLGYANRKSDTLWDVHTISGYDDNNERYITTPIGTTIGLPPNPSALEVVNALKTQVYRNRLFFRNIRTSSLTVAQQLHSLEIIVSYLGREDLLLRRKDV